MAYHLQTNKTWQETADDIADTMRKWRVTSWELVKMPRMVTTSYSLPPGQRRVILRYVKDGVPVELAMDRQERIVDNARVLYLAVEALRMNDERGIADIVREAYAQLPAPTQETPARDPYVVLGVHPNAALETIETFYRALAKRAHPDAGGSPEQFRELTSAMEQIRKERGG